jgi:hypothetical protein
MKKLQFLVSMCFTLSMTQAQEINEALRYAQDNLNGTARFSAMSGAFGALGGDLSSLNINPAGTAIFNNNQVGATLSNFAVKNNATYFGNGFLEKNNAVDLNQAGAVFVFKNNVSNNDWKKFSLAINYENKNNFNNAIVSAGTNPTNSIDSYFLYFANRNGGESLQNLKLQEDESITDLYDFLGANYGFGTQQAFLGYQGYVTNEATNYDESTNRQYVSSVPSGANYYQENEVTATGYNGKISFNGATSYQNKLFLGLNLNAHFIDYTQSSSFYEENDAALTSDYTVSRLRFNNELYTYGNGFSFQLGAIVKATKEIRLGLAYESPTYYNLNDELSQSLRVVSEATNSNATNDFVNPQIINVFEPYKLQTPSKLTGSFAYIFGKTGLLSLDYAIRDYSNTKYKPDNDFSAINTAMENILNQTGEFRIGGEYKIKQWSLRGGYRFEESPYKNKTTMGDLRGYSGGLGYNFGSTKLDVSYSTSKRNSFQSFFSQGFTDGSRVNTQNNNVSLTLLFEL